MKKFISMVMAAAMVVSLVPATAFAASGSAKFSVAGAQEWNKTNVGAGSLAGTQIQLEVTDINGKVGVPDSFEITLDFDGAEANTAWGGVWDAGTIGVNGVLVTRTQDNGSTVKVPGTTATWEAVAAEDTSFKFTLTEGAADIVKGDKIIIQLDGSWVMSSKSEGSVAKVTVGGDFGTSSEMTVGSVLGKTLDISVAGKNVEVPQEEIATLKTITIKSKVGNFAAADEIKVKVSKGFEITNVGAFSTGALVGTAEDDFFKVNGVTASQFTITGMQIEATTAKPGDVCTLTVTCKNYDSDSDEAAVVIADAVVMSVDEDADVPVMYAGTDETETGLTSNEDHKSLKVTIEESAKDVWDDVSSFTMTLPEGVYVQDVTGEAMTGVTVNKFDTTADVDGLLKKAYVDGDFEEFEFGRRAITVNTAVKSKIEFQLVLVADPDFEGDVTLTLEGKAFGDEPQEVVIAKFVAPYTVEASQNDLIIDYKETEVPTDVVIKEAEAGLWSKTAGQNRFILGVESVTILPVIEVEDAGDVTVNDESGMEVKQVGTGFDVKETSDDEAAVVTLSGIKLYMNRNVAAGAYDLVAVFDMHTNYLATVLFGQTGSDTVEDVTEWDGVIKEGWINVITAGRDQDDASFTKKVVVPVGEKYIVAGEETVTLDVPAYVSAAGYTMLPVRAVAVALGINNNSVLWDGATKTVTILYGQRIITMVAGQKVIYVNGSAIPASASVEIVDGRTFLPMRDLATALGVTDITWDAATKTATLNGNK